MIDITEGNREGYILLLRDYHTQARNLHEAAKRVFDGHVIALGAESGFTIQLSSDLFLALFDDYAVHVSDLNHAHYNRPGFCAVNVNHEEGSNAKTTHPKAA